MRIINNAKLAYKTIKGGMTIMKRKNKSLLSLILVFVISTACSKVPLQISGRPYQNTGVKPPSLKALPETSPEKALRQLMEGNERFVSGKPAEKDISSERRKNLSEKGQSPHAVILSCSDSRVPPEIVFDQGLGEIFVVRNAGNVVEPVALGSIEYAVKYLGVPLIVVMGHEKCGAIKAAVDGEETTRNIEEIINKIEPSVLKARSQTNNKEKLYEKAEDENVINSIEEIKKSEVIRSALVGGKIQIIGAKYHLESGRVELRGINQGD